jgi:hypothetical protein
MHFLPEFLFFNSLCSICSDTQIDNFRQTYSVAEQKKSTFNIQPCHGHQQTFLLVGQFFGGFQEDNSPKNGIKTAKNVKTNHCKDPKTTFFNFRG